MSESDYKKLHVAYSNYQQICLTQKKYYEMEPTVLKVYSC